jgi:ferrous iron transport protein A
MSIGTEAIIRKINGNDQTVRHLGALGLIAGEPVTVIARHGGSLILRIKGSRIAVDRQLAGKIQI